MTPIRVAGSVLGLVTGIWVIAVQHYTGGSGNGSTSMLVIGAFLGLVSVGSFGGFRWLFLVGAVLSATLGVLVLLLWGSFPANDDLTILVLSAVSLLVDLGASRPSRELSEKDSPLNLPVFG